MAFTRDDIRTSLRGLVQDDAPFLTAAELDEHISRGVRQVNHDKPRTVVVDITGDNSRDYDMPSEFQRGFSDIQSVETPAGENPPVFRDRNDDWFIYEDPTQTPTLRLKFKESTPTPSEIIRVTIFAPHVLTNDSSTSTVISQTTFLAIIYKAAVFAFRSLAARFNETLDPSIAADAVDYGARSQAYLFLAERWETQYKGIVGLGQSTKAAQALAEVDVVFTSGEDFLFHPRKTR